MDEGSQLLDASALRFNQMSIITLVLLGFITDQRAVPGFVAVVMVAGSILPPLGLFKQAYFRIIKPLKLMTPDLVDDSPVPHQFAQLLGGIMLGVGTGFLYGGFSVAGWTLAWIVVFLAAANVFWGFCAGCFIYYQLARLHVPGFRHSEVDGKSR
jgi:hypothetical protein